MRKRIGGLIIVSVLMISLAAQTEDAAVWEQLYRTVPNDEQRVALLNQVAEKRARENIPIFEFALGDVIASRIDSGTTAQRVAKHQIARIAIQELVALNSRASVELIHDVYVNTSNAELKSTAAVALGNLKAVEFLPRLVRDLTSINNGPVAAQAREQETIAGGLVQALSLMGDTAGFEAVFMASLGWYSSASKVRESAREALTEMVEDPTDPLLNIILLHPDMDTKQAALEASLGSRAPANRKAELASRALRIGIDRVANDVAARIAGNRLRVTALNALIESGDKNPERVPMYLEIIELDRRDDATLEQTLKAYHALGVNGTDEAVRFMSTRLSQYNDLEKLNGNDARDKGIIRQLVISLGKSGNPRARPALMGASLTDYDSAIARAIQDSLQTLPR